MPPTRRTTPTRPTPRWGPKTRPADPPSASALGRCVDPVTPEAFRAEYWERRPLVAERGPARRFDDLLSEPEIERLLTSGLRHPAFRLVKAGEQIPLADYTVDIPWRPAPFAKTADPGRVAAAFAGGATIVLQGLHHWWHPLAVFARELERELGQPAQANAYWTPRDSQGLPIHHDTHDVFVLQVAGEKRWLIYEPVWELPLKDQRYKPEMGEPGEPVVDVTLEAGDTLYLPRGWLHQALTSEDDSLHLTIGVNVYTWIDAFRAALSACEADARFRRSIPGDGGGADELVDAVREALAPEAVARRKRRKLVQTRRPILDGHISDLRALDGIDLDTSVERRATVIADVAERDGAVVLVFEGKTVAFPERVRDEVGWVARGGPFTARELPGDLDEEGRLALVGRLVREGFLRLSPDARDTPSPRSGAGARGGATST